MRILNVQPVLIAKDISGFAVQFFDELRQPCQFFGVPVCALLLCDFPVVGREPQAAVCGEGGDVSCIKVRHKIGPL